MTPGKSVIIEDSILFEFYIHAENAKLQLSWMDIYFCMTIFKNYHEINYSSDRIRQMGLCFLVGDGKPHSSKKSGFLDLFHGYC